MTHGYSPVRDAISRLAANGVPTRQLMTAGFMCFGIAVPVYSGALRAAMPGHAWIAALTSGLAIVGVALAPLDHSPALDTLHAVAAGIGYAGLASTSLLSARQFARFGATKWARLGVVTGTVSAICLAVSTAGTANGLFQRIGLTAGDVFLAASGVAIASGHFPNFETAPARAGATLPRR